jgi:putative membrane protein
MFIDYITVMLVNMSGGLFILAHFVYKGLAAPEKSSWAPAFAMVGIVALATGLHMSFTWPIPKLDQVNLSFANIAYGEMTILFGALFLGGALAVLKNRGFEALAIYAFFAGLAAVVVGVRIGKLGLTNSPQLTAVGFVLTGLAGILACPLWRFRENKPARIVVSVILAIAGLIWAFTGYMAYWGHIAKFSQMS